MSADAAVAIPSAADLSGLTLTELLAKLEPIPEPIAISYLPETEIWLWLLGALFGLGFALGWIGHRRWQARAYRRAALAELRDTQDVAGMALILRRTALVAYPREDVASLIGEEWLGFLDRTLDRTLDHGSGARPDRLGQRGAGAAPHRARFRTPLGRSLVASSYVPDTAEGLDIHAMRSLVVEWVRKHPDARPNAAGGPA